MSTTVTAWMLATFLLGTNDQQGPENVVVLGDYAPCGLNCLFLVAQLRDTPTEWEELKKMLGPPDEHGMHSFASLSQAARDIGMFPVGVRADWKGLHDLPMPVIVQVQDTRFPSARPHLLVVLRPTVDGVHLLDSPYAPYFLPKAQFEECWSGNVLAFGQNEDEAQNIGTPTHSYSDVVFCFGIVVAVFLLFLMVVRLVSWSSICETCRVVRARPSRWIAWGGFWATCFVLVAIYCCVKNTWAITPARCIFERPLMELGHVEPGRKIIQLPLKNDGDEPLKITSVVSSCTCTVVKAPAVIEARENGLLELELTVAPGPRRVHLTVNSNDPEGGKSFVLSWYGTAHAQLIPSKISGSSVPFGKTYERVMRLIFPGGNEAITANILKCECDSPRVTIREGKYVPSPFLVLK